ncbi:MAG: DNA alkylation repair protein [Gemmatimonadota bacterium]
MTRPIAPSSRVAEVIELLRRRGSKAGLASMARYAIPSGRAFGVSMSQMKVLSKKLGADHRLAAELWASGWYEARMLACLLDDPALVTAAQMDRWSREFDNWAIADTACFALFDRTSDRWRMVEKWSRSPREFVRRGAFALLWGLTVHDKAAPDAEFLKGLAVIERAATDQRHWVKLAVNMALRATGKRNAALNRAAVASARRLAGATDPTARWIGSHALRELTGAGVQGRITRQKPRPKQPRSA